MRNLTLILILATLTQADFIKLPERIDLRFLNLKEFSKEELKEVKLPELYVPELNEHTGASS